jgi:hypothetical protein
MSEFPPLANLNDAPLHGADTQGGGWACQGGDATDWRCGACVEAAEKWLEAEGDRLVPWNPSATGLAAGTCRVMLSWLIERSWYLGVMRPAKCPEVGASE